jgi:hypothetical protein
VFVSLNDLLVERDNRADSFEEVKKPIGKIIVDFSVIEILQSPGLADGSD